MEDPRGLYQRYYPGDGPDSRTVISGWARITACFCFDGVTGTSSGSRHRVSIFPPPRLGTLLAARDGTLWIGTTKGLASWKGDKLTVSPELAGRFVFALFEDHEGTVWAGGVAFPPPGRLCAIQSGSVHCDGEDGSLGFGVFGLYEDSKGNLWVGVHSGLWRWRPGTPEFHSMPDVPDGIQAFAEDDDGALLIVMRGRNPTTH